MNKMNSDQLFIIILVTVFTLGIGLLTALKYSDAGEGGHKSAQVAAAGENAEKHAPAGHAPAEH